MSNRSNVWVPSELVYMWANIHVSAERNSRNRMCQKLDEQVSYSLDLGTDAHHSRLTNVLLHESYMLQFAYSARLNLEFDEGGGTNARP